MGIAVTKITDIDKSIAFTRTIYGHRTTKSSDYRYTWMERVAMAEFLMDTDASDEEIIAALFSAAFTVSDMTHLGVQTFLSRLDVVDADEILEIVQLYTVSMYNKHSPADLLMSMSARSPKAVLCALHVWQAHLYVSMEHRLRYNQRYNQEQYKSCHDRLDMIDSYIKAHRTMEIVYIVRGRVEHLRPVQKAVVEVV